MTESSTRSKPEASPTSALMTIWIFGAASILLAIVGLFLEAKTITRIGFLGNTKEAPFVVLAFYIMSGINFLFMTLVATGGYLLLRYNRRGITFASTVLVSELAYLILLAILPFTGPVGDSINVATGIGNVAIMVQAVIAYPLIAPIGLTLCRLRLRRIDALV